MNELNKSELLKGKYKSGQELVTETIALYETFRDLRTDWAQMAQENAEFRLGKQWSSEQVRTLQDRGQAPVAINRLHPAVETAKALLTSNRPSFRCVAREDSDNKVARVMSGLMEYIWQISDGETILRNAIDDYYVKGMGAICVYIDPFADMGRGEVKIKDIDPLDIYIDPNSRDRFADDAEVVVSRLFTKEQANLLEFNYRDAIKAASSDYISDRPETGNSSELPIFFPEGVTTMTVGMTYKNTEYIRGYERFSPLYLTYYRTFEAFTGKEDLLDDFKFKEYVNKPAWIIGEQIVTDPFQVQQMMAQMQQMLSEAEQGDPAEQMPELPQIQQVTYYDLIKMGQIEVIKTPIRRIVQSVIMGDKHLYTRVLETDKHPVVLFMNVHTRTPYPLSDVGLVKDLQRALNKMQSLIIAHATTSTNMKVLIPMGSVDMQEFERKWALPGVGIEVDMDMGTPIVAQPHPLPNELYMQVSGYKTDIDHQLGLYEMMAGNSGAAPTTYKATIAMDEFGQRKIRSKLSDIESGLRRVGEVALAFIQALYTSKKIFRIIQPNNSINEFIINNRMVDDKTNEIKVMNDVSVGKYDVIVVAGSTLPTNRFAELELYMEAYKNGIIDQVEVLKKTEVFDIEGVIQRSSMLNQLQGVVQQQQEEIKGLKGDKQTRDRENLHLKQRLEVEKTKVELDKFTNQAKAGGQVYEETLTRLLQNTKEKGKLEIEKEKLNLKRQMISKRESSSNKKKR